MEQHKPLTVNQWSAFVGSKCPRCRQGNVFYGPMYSFKAQKMNEHCPVCDLKFEREPGYFYVAMFVSYALNVAQTLITCIGAYMLGLPLDFDHMWYYIAIPIVTSVLLAPFNYRFSRMILLYWLSPGLHYEPNRALKK